MEFFKEVSELALISHQALLPILLTISDTIHIVILARWCVYKIVFLFWCAVLTVLTQITISTVTLRVMTNCINDCWLLLIVKLSSIKL